MGGKSSIESVPDKVRDHVDVERCVQRWGLGSEELLFLFQRFHKLDKDNSGSVKYEEFFQFNPDPQWRLHGTIFNMVVPQTVNQLKFPAWLIAVLSFCFMTNQEIMEQVFVGYDHSKVGRLNVKDMQNMMVSIHGDNLLFPREIVETVTLVIQSKKGRIDFDDFVRACQRYPMLLWPIQRIQRLLRNYCFKKRKLFKEIDLRSTDVVWRHKIGAAKATGTGFWKRIGWDSKKETILTYCCGWCCCKRPPQGLELDVENISEDRMRAQRMMLEAAGGLEEEEEDLQGLTAEERQQMEQLAIMELYDDSGDSSNASFTDVEINDYGPVFW